MQHDAFDINVCIQTTTHCGLQLPELVCVGLGEVGEVQVGAQGEYELVYGGGDQVHPPQVGLEVHRPLPAGQLKLLEEADALVGQVGEGAEGKHRPENNYWSFERIFLGKNM